MERKDFGIMWTMPPTERDKHNAEIAGVRRIVLTYGTILGTTLAYLRGQGVGVVVRFTRDDVHRTPGGLEAVRDRLAGIRDSLGGLLQGIICGNEPEVDLDFTFEGNWRGDLAFVERVEVGTHLIFLSSLGVPLIAPAFSAHGVGGGETEKLYPGLFQWREIIAPIAHEYPQIATHLYTDNNRSVVDYVRLRQAARFWASFWHKPIFLDEVGVNNGPEHERVSAYIGLAEWLCGENNPVGARITGLVPFVANGTAEWEGYLIKEEESYRRIGEFIRGG